MRIHLIPLLSILPVTYTATLFLTLYLQSTALLLYVTRHFFHPQESLVHLAALGYLFLLTYPVAAAVTTLAIAATVEGGYDSRVPWPLRVGLKGWAARATAAHDDLQRLFPGAAVAILTAHILNVPTSHLAPLSTLLFLSRLTAYIAHVSNADMLRDSSSLIAHACPVLLFGFAIFPSFGEHYSEAKQLAQAIPT
jgi:uncharacterized MAPEG superfamily protein